VTLDFVVHENNKNPSMFVNVTAKKFSATFYFDTLYTDYFTFTGKMKDTVYYQMCLVKRYIRLI